MANKSLNDIHEIPFLSEWKHKDGEVYMAMGVKNFEPAKGYKIPLVTYKQIGGNVVADPYVRTVKHFKESFTKVLF